MAITRLKRKHRKNIARANNKQRVIKQLLATPVIKNVDIEELKAQFKNKPVVATAVNEVKSTIAEVAHTVVDKVEDASSAVVGDVKSTISEATQVVADKVEAASTVAGDVKTTVAEAAHTVVDKVEDVVEAVKDKVEDVVDAVKDKVKDFFGSNDEKTAE